MRLAFTIEGKPQPKQTVRVGSKGAGIPRESRAYMQLVARDDCQCLPRVMVLGVDRENPRVELELEVLS